MQRKAERNRSNEQSNASRKWGALTAAAVIVGGAAAHRVDAQVFWTGGGAPSTNWNTGANWDNFGDPAKPGFADQAVLNNGGTITINDSQVVGSLEIGRPADTALNPSNLGLGGTVNFESSGTLSSGGAIPSVDVGVAGTNNVWNHNGGTLTTNNLFRVGVAAGAVGTVNVHGGLIDVVPTNDGPPLKWFLIGDNGTGIVNMDGGAIHSSDWFVMGIQPSGNGTLNISAGEIAVQRTFTMGLNSNMAAKLGATTALNMSGGTITVGGSPISTSVRLSDGAWAKTTVTQSGGTFRSLNEVLVGSWGDMTYTLSGSGVLDADGQVNVATFNAVERPEGSADAVTVHFTQSGNTTVQGAGIVIGEYGHAVYTLNGGTLRALGETRGTATVPGPAYLNMLIGRDGGGINQGKGELIQNGGDVIVAKHAFLGDFNDSSGNWTVSGGTVSIGGNLSVGGALASNAPADADRLEPSEANGAQGQALNASGTFRVRGGAATINVSGKLLANPADKGASRSGAGQDNHSTLAFEIGAGGALSKINVAEQADVDGAVIDMGFMSTTTFVPAYHQQFELVNASLFGSTGTGTTQNVGTGSNAALAAGDAADWTLSVINVSGGRQALVAINEVVPGDTDNNKKVTFADLLTLAKNYNKLTDQTRATGDFDRTGSVTFADLLILAKNYNFGNAAATQATLDPSSPIAADWALAQSLVPEPAMLSWLGLAGAGLMRRRRAGRVALAGI